jgi:hypothetical protein
MPKNNSISKETRQQLTELFISGARNQDAADAVNISLGRANYFRTKLVAAGVIDRKRNKRTKAAMAAAAVAKIKTVKTPASKPTSIAEDVAAPSFPVETPDLTAVLGNMFVFRINNMEVQISEANKVHVKKGMIEIKY